MSNNNELFLSMSTMTSFLDLISPSKHERHAHQPDYDVNQRHADYEERRYYAGTWVCTDVNGLFVEQSRIVGFRKLQAYIGGHNAEGVQMVQAVPILTKLSPTSMTGFENKFTVCMFLPLKSGVSAPQPKSADIFIQEIPAMTVFVRKFEGVTNDEKWICEAKELADSLRDKKEFHTEFYFTAGYNSPYSLVHNTNEVWLVQNILEERHVTDGQTILPAVSSDSSTKIVSSVLPSAVSSNLHPSVNIMLAIVLLYIKLVWTCLNWFVCTVHNVTGRPTTKISSKPQLSVMISSVVQMVHQQVRTVCTCYFKAWIR